MQTIKLLIGTFEYDPSRPLGRRGGFGQVFVGKSPSGEEVAIKKLHLSAADAAHRELRIAEELKGRSFEHVIPFIDAGEDADTGTYFVVMPKAESSLQTEVDKKRGFAPNEAASILLQIGKGLIEVGELVHRDLKPDNILFHEKKWKIADFGIARFVEEATASNTLKECLSPWYAAPEQWRSDRATHATDVYALGCIGFCLLTGSPPFTANPRDQHLTEGVPNFACSDPRLQTLINMSLRKLPETRPQLSRVHQLLTDIVSSPSEPKHDPVWLVAKAAAEVAARDQRVQAASQLRETAENLRSKLRETGSEVLRENLERLWGKVHSHAANAMRSNSVPGMLQCNLGGGSLAITLADGGMAEEAAQSGWNVVLVAQAIVYQTVPQFEWSSNLFYAARRATTAFRWYEVSFWTMTGRNRDEPYACSDWREADLALSNVIHTVGVAFGPKPIDDENEADFHDRWLWLFAMASTGKLRKPANMPIPGWPPY